VLDVGCANGYLASILAERGYTVTGLEREGGFDPGQFPPNVQLLCADLERGLPPLRTRFDYVICADILEHLRDPEGLLRQIRDVLAPGGAIIASLPNSGNFWFRCNVLLGRFPQDEKGLFDRTHVRFYVWNGWAQLFRSAGYRISQVEPTAVPVGLMVPPAFEHSPPVVAAESVFYGLARIWKRMFAYQFVVRAEPILP
jgi:SAM-dependent methyltransferase